MTLFQRAVHSISDEFYTAVQREAWAPVSPDYDSWRKKFDQSKPYICLVNEKIAGFIELNQEGYIDCLYVDPNFQCQGVASYLYHYVEELALARNNERLSVDASKVAKNFFIKKGFTVVRENQVMRYGVVLENFSMQKDLVLKQD
ncbi:GNAT family N-acetyltransferase [Neisseria sp. Ec49-e6-T10]|uniref:GNAT family N-acetyltransferase n=1 Tax=Neisseria sp. Ec49-e6-T10 TaxID=3140744 RepID=UPI003EC0CBFC